MTSRSSLSILLQGEQSIALRGFSPPGFTQLRGTLTDLVYVALPAFAGNEHHTRCYHEFSPFLRFYFEKDDSIKV
jgi:hypothetical protein